MILLSCSFTPKVGFFIRKIQIYGILLEIHSVSATFVKSKRKVAVVYSGQCSSLFRRLVKKINTQRGFVMKIVMQLYCLNN